MAGRTNVPHRADGTRQLSTVLRAGAAGLLAAVLVLAGCGDDDPDRMLGPVEASDGDGVQPRIFEDHWHAAYGIYICDDFLPDEAYHELFDSVLGIHSHQDGIIHIHPTSRDAAGENARLGVFVEASASFDLTDDRITVGSQSWEEGVDTCSVDGEDVPGEVVVAYWDDVLEEDNPPAVEQSGVGDLRFRADHEGFVIAFVPEDGHNDIPLPASVRLIPYVSATLEEIPPPEDLPLFDDDLAELFEELPHEILEELAESDPDNDEPPLQDDED
jgi:hypothetical protein